MRLVAILVAAGVVLLANAWALISVRQNRKDTFGGNVELTENELRLPPLVGDSTVIQLGLEWRTRTDGSEAKPPPDWLNAAKLTELGIDCRVPVTDANARDYYSSRLPVEACLVLEYRGESSGTAHLNRKPRTRLFVVDAGRDAHQLRSQYPDPARHAIARGVVRCVLQEYEYGPNGRTRLEPPRLQGWIEMLVPEIYVPRPYSRLLQGLRSRADRERGEPPKTPRFAVKVAWGNRLEPWVQEVRLLLAARN